jgi:hypothetical protein
MGDGGEGDGRGAVTCDVKKALALYTVNHSILSVPVSLYDRIKWIATSLFSLSLSSLCGPNRSFASLTVSGTVMGHGNSSPVLILVFYSNSHVCICAWNV